MGIADVRLHVDYHASEHAGPVVWERDARERVARVDRASGGLDRSGRPAALALSILNPGFCVCGCELVHRRQRPYGAQRRMLGQDRIVAVDRRLGVAKAAIRVPGGLAGLLKTSEMLQLPKKSG